MTYSKIVLTGGVTANGDGTVATTLTNSQVLGQPLTGLSATTGSILSSDTVVGAFGKVQGNTPKYIGTGSDNIMSPFLPSTVTNITLTSTTAYAVYVGYVIKPITAEFVRYSIATDGTGLATAEVGLFTSVSAPNTNNQLLTKVVSGNSGFGVGIRTNIANFSQSIPTNKHLWAVLRTSYVTTQPQVSSVFQDLRRGFILTGTMAGLMSGVVSFTGNIIATIVANQCPHLSVTIV
jgi:hypothetical protein